jgi:hypothetical protein
MSAETNAGLSDGPASEIETDALNCGGHDSKMGRTDFRTVSEACSLNIDKVAQLARLYAAGTPPEQEFRAIKEWANAASNDELPGKDNSSHLAREEGRIPEDIWPPGLTHDPHTAGNAFSQRTEIVRDESDFSAGFRALESSIRVVARPSGSKQDGLVSALTRGRISRTFALFFSAALIGLALGWYSHRVDIVKRWASSVDRFLSVSAERSLPTPATSSELSRREIVIAPDFRAARPGAEQSGSHQEQIDVATMRAAKPNARSKTSSALLHSREKRAPVPETRPTIIEGWRVREVTSGEAVLEGPNGVWTAKPGDTVPGVGRIESIVLWGERWIVATSSGLISTR